MKTADLIVAWLVVLLGAVHSAFTLKVYGTFSVQAVWFLSAGLLLMLLGAVNLLRVRYAAVAGGVRVVSIVANLVLLAFVIAVAATLPLKENPQAVVLVALVVLMTVCSIARRPQRP